MKDRAEKKEYEQAIAENRVVKDPSKAELVSIFILCGSKVQCF